MRDCVTHHYACDCREKKFEELEAENEKIKSRIDEIIPSETMAKNNARLILENADLKTELARVKGIAKKVCDYYERVANTEEVYIGNFARECKKELGE